MDRALYSIEETRARFAQQPLRHVASRQPSERCHRVSPFRVGGGDYRADQEFHDIGKPIAGRRTVTAAVGQYR